MDDEERRLVSGYVGYGVCRFRQVEALADRAAHQQRLRRIRAFMSEGAARCASISRKSVGPKKSTTACNPASQWNALRNVRKFQSCRAGSNQGREMSTSGRSPDSKAVRVDAVLARAANISPISRRGFVPERSLAATDDSQSAPRRSQPR
jgi:hypothetical protein